MTFETPHSPHEDDSRVADVHKAHLMALTEDEVRERVDNYDALAEAYLAQAEKSKDIRAYRIVEGFWEDADNLRRTINERAEYTGDRYDEIMKVVDDIKVDHDIAETFDEAFLTEQVKAHLDSALGHIGVIGARQFTHVSAEEFTNNIDVQRALGLSRVVKSAILRRQVEI